jgi:hypothetical protein
MSEPDDRPAIPTVSGPASGGLRRFLHEQALPALYLTLGGALLALIIWVSSSIVDLRLRNDYREKQFLLEREVEDLKISTRVQQGTIDVQGKLIACLQKEVRTKKAHHLNVGGTYECMEDAH